MPRPEGAVERIANLVRVDAEAEAAPDPDEDAAGLEEPLEAELHAVTTEAARSAAPRAKGPFRRVIRNPPQLQEKRLCGACFRRRTSAIPDRLQNDCIRHNRVPSLTTARTVALVAICDRSGNSEFNSALGANVF